MLVPNAEACIEVEETSVEPLRINVRILGRFWEVIITPLCGKLDMLKRTRKCAALNARAAAHEPDHYYRRFQQHLNLLAPLRI